VAAHDNVPDGRQARLSSHVLVLVGVGLWSTNFTAIEAALNHGFEPLAFSAVRWAIAGAAICGLALYRERSIRVARADFALVIGAAGGLFLINQVAAVYALNLGAATTTAITFGLVPVFVAVIAHVRGLESLDLRHWTGTAVSLIGVGLLALGAGKISGDLASLALALVNVGTFAGYIVLSATLLRRYSALRVTALTVTASAVGLALLGSVQMAAQPWDSLDRAAWSALAYAVASVVIANAVWLEGTRRVGPSRAAVYSNLLPLLGAIIALVALDERLTELQFLGGGVILVGLAIVSVRCRPAPA